MKSTPPSTADIRAAIGEIDIPAAEQALANAEARRKALLLTATADEPIIAAEVDITRCRIARDRAVAREAALQTQLAESAAADQRAEFRRRYDEATRLADNATSAITTAFPKLANQILDIVEQEHAADKALAAINLEITESGNDMALIESPSTRVWGGKFLRPFTFRDIISLPETDGNPAHGAAAREVTMEGSIDLCGVGQPLPVPAFQYQ